MQEVENVLTVQLEANALQTVLRHVLLVLSVCYDKWLALIVLKVDLNKLLKLDLQYCDHWLRTCLVASNISFFACKPMYVCKHGEYITHSHFIQIMDVLHNIIWSFLGTFQSQSEQAACEECPYNYECTSTSKAICPVGSYSALGQMNCDACPPGKSTIFSCFSAVFEVLHEVWFRVARLDYLITP